MFLFVKEKLVFINWRAVNRKRVIFLTYIYQENKTFKKMSLKMISAKWKGMCM